ncbi:magnesium-translocating P-type ATPase [Candidatus Shapirobacteria bacterium CG08_land_8_20_14_0_20_39_18]|uniref:Magnesium-transporting ATPase, P-type 1 n=1 Tax=Candidatus Shapirobacteria bacterium CG08_land_8_20_14_0_20_39_18 TaxID=1974883 RepID=A0A2M6XEA5_9BACT|nr:MAG: magnesium-translocating P-type ATPase [Candidatus Shapirobacteria bacterium CG08_land_8_20_14_0_20_39_18]PIY64721.1 MAG: magnesium-translocating P-type ATPase [Candidatus Shapirobacteria bacterium CG_4_10_14_0_8_um_filter_39_15]PJE68673.1 MAG: magnesium-translocating P-type ATPase [Candidatus Shapirobacteria bacterium CG10_big_fil_rev_8_21_14_0_10_38_8]
MNGLSSAEAKTRLIKNGFNELPKEKSKSIIQKFIRQLSNPLILLLLFSGSLSVLLGQKIDSFVIITILFISISLDVYQEDKAQKAVEKLKEKTALKTTVLQDGKMIAILAKEIVIGDIVILSTGNIVPADGKVLETSGFQVDQSAITGESFPQYVGNEEIVFSGSEVVSGEAKVLITATGVNSKLGQVALQLEKPRPKTEFEKGINSFGLMLGRLTLVMAAILFVLNILLGHSLIGSLLFVLSLAIGFAPELLPMIVTINLSNGAIRISRKGVIVKNLSSIENFGSIDILCTDKTGTLTENQIQLEDYEDINGKKDEKVLVVAYLNSYFQSGIKGAFEKAIVNKSPKIEGYNKENEIAFDFYRKRLSVIVSNGSERLLISKGAPESIIPTCLFLSLDKRTRIEKRFQQLSQDGFRVLAIAEKKIEKQKEYSLKDETKLSFVGLIVFSDPPKVTARPALESLKNSGVSLRILTGDNELVTKYVCEKLGIEILKTMSGDELELLDHQQLNSEVEQTTVFYRLNPDQKEKVIASLRASGHVVGFLGDGVNDAPSLRVADIGISVENAVDVAKEAADFILLHKDLRVLHEGIIEGRKTFGNIIKYIKMGTSSTFGNMISLAGASLFLPFLPLLPVQVLLNDLLYDTSQLLLTRDGVDKHYLDMPKRWSIKSIQNFMLVFGPINSLFDFLAMFILLYLFKASVSLFQTGWFLESLITQTLIVLSIRTRIMPFYKSKTDNLFAIGLFVIALFGLALPYSPLAALLHLIKPPVFYYFWLAVIVICYFVLVEIVKKIFYSRVSE